MIDLLEREVWNDYPGRWDNKEPVISGFDDEDALRGSRWV